MYSLLLKDREYPISVYLSYMMRVRELTRADAIALLTHSAVKLGLRKNLTPPGSNTIARWGRTTDVPQWAIVTALSITEGLGKIPFTDKEWAFWGYSAAERGADIGQYSGKWREWLEKAYRFKREHESRTEYRTRFKSFSNPDISSKILIFYKGNNLDFVNIPTLLIGLATTREIQPLIDNALNNNKLFTEADRQAALEVDTAMFKLDCEIADSVKELEKVGFATYLCNGNIVFT
ncbi:hypothetical protein D8682_00610 (plasmid) [Buttiauxella sp. 3AFRM03]|uniref:hypothetical protein n=1 Tax=Buttiauxella sp. 3AFRM03 TaxID=2479367 RepID=UPI000EF77CC8|nr:hypothetical protein [Buttiauxella sp. 3AFRM03]AYN25610.1 hypothetical protein D8682_00610 [Buttiauxella sp. 3AFRM03]